LDAEFGWLMESENPALGKVLNPHKKPGSGVCLDIPNNKAGTVTVRDAGGRSLTIHIRPKIHGASIEGMLNIALDAISDETAQLQLSHSSIGPSAWLSASFIKLAKKYAKNMRMEGVEREESLQGRVRGTVMVGAYVRHIPTKLHHIPCRYIEWTQDNQLNQHIKQGLNAAIRVLQEQNLIEKMMEGKRVLRLFSGVSEHKIQRHKRERFTASLGPSQRHLKPLLHLANAIIDQRRPGNESLHRDTFVGSRLFECGKTSTNALEITWDLVSVNLLFERYVANLLYYLHLTESEHEDAPYGWGEKKTNDWKYSLSSSTELSASSPLYDIFMTEKDNERRKSIELDAHPLKNGMLIDSKWKRGTVSNADLYQLVAYATHRKMRKKHTGLVFPQPSVTQDDAAYISPSGDIYTTEGNKGIDLGQLEKRELKEGSSLEFVENTEQHVAPAWIDLGHWEGEGGDEGIPIHVFQVRVDEEGIKQELNRSRSFHGLASQIQSVSSKTSQEKGA